jgi:predicted lipoprotein with Yx(FWY)xxD motif
MPIKPLIGLMALAAIGLAACGSSGNYTTPGGAGAAPVQTSAPAPAVSSTIVASANYGTTAMAPATSTPAAPAQASVRLADTPLGKIVVDSQGRTLYAFTNDANGASTCTGACAMAWPAATVTGDSIAGPGITAPLSLVAAPSGGEMLKAGMWPLYRFSGDAAAGDTNGQGSGGVWFVVNADGKLVKS